MPSDPNASTAPVPDVTDAMMEHAARHAAEQADGVAHHTLQPAPVEAPAANAPIAADAVAAPEPAPQEVRETAADEPLADEAAAEPAPTVAQASEVPVSEASEPPPMDPHRPAAPAASIIMQVEQVVEEASPITAATLPASSTVFETYNTKVVDMMRANMAATSAHLAALLQARSVPEAMALNADHLRRQLDALTAQGRELSSLAQELTLAAMQPLKVLIAPDR